MRQCGNVIALLKRPIPNEVRVLMMSMLLLLLLMMLMMVNLMSMMVSIMRLNNMMSLVC